MKPTSPTVWLGMTFRFLYWRNSRAPLFRRRSGLPSPPIQLALVGGCRHRSLPWGWRWTTEKFTGFSTIFFSLEPNVAAERTAHGTEFTSTCFLFLSPSGNNEDVRFFFFGLKWRKAKSGAISQAVPVPIEDSRGESVSFEPLGRDFPGPMLF